jgi:hypothetical protein
MQEAIVAVVVLIVGGLIGSFFKPTEAQLAPLSPDQIKVPGAGHAEESAHHH